MSETPIVTLKGMRLEVSGQEVLIISVPFPAPNKPEFGNPYDHLTRLQNQIPVVFVSQKSDGTYVVVGPDQWKGKIDSKTISASQWMKIPIYEGDVG